MLTVSVRSKLPAVFLFLALNASLLAPAGAQILHPAKIASEKTTELDVPACAVQPPISLVVSGAEGQDHFYNYGTEMRFLHHSGDPIVLGTGFSNINVVNPLYLTMLIELLDTTEASLSVNGVDFGALHGNNTRRFLNMFLGSVLPSGERHIFGPVDLVVHYRTQRGCSYSHSLHIG